MQPGNMMTILITIEGGVIQNITADDANVRVIVKDFDEDADGGVVWSDFPTENRPDIIQENLGEMAGSVRHPSVKPDCD